MKRDADVPARNVIPPFAALRAFDAVARAGGVRRAATELGLDHAVVSRHLRALESWTGSVLMQRGRGGSVLTAEGERYHAAIASAIDLMAAATRDLMKAGDHGHLTIWAMPGFTSKWLLPRITTFEADNRELAIDVRPSDQPPDFNRHDADIDIRYAPSYGRSIDLPSNVRTLEIARPAVVPVASADYLASRPPIRTAADLLQHDLLHEESFENWRAWLAAHDVIAGDELSGTRLWHAHLTVDAARQGRGIALANHFVATDDLRAGRLIEIGGGNAGFARLSLGSYLFIARSDRWSTPAIARFRQWLVATAASELASVP